MSVKNAWTIYIYLADTLTQLIKQLVHSLHQDESTVLVFAIKLFLLMRMLCYTLHTLFLQWAFHLVLRQTLLIEKQTIWINIIQVIQSGRNARNVKQTPHRVITFTALEMFAQSVPRLSETRFIWQCTRYVIVCVWMYNVAVLNIRSTFSLLYFRPNSTKRIWEN